jgi:DNA invertase Pin-like site-specific DNA recombinase
MADYFYARVSHRVPALNMLSENTQFGSMSSYRNSLRVNATFGKLSYPADLPSGWFVDRAKSGWSLDLHERTAGALLLNVLQPGDRLFIHSISRLSRSVIGFGLVMQRLFEMGVEVHFVQEQIDFSTAAGKLMGNMLAVLAQYHSDMISERTKEALALKRAGLLSGKKRVKSVWSPSCVYMPQAKQLPIVPTTGRILCYIRCSHVDSEESGLGLEQQYQSVMRYADSLAAKRGMTVHPELFYDLSVSAFHNKLEEREGGKRLLGEVKSGDQIVFYRCDRAFRIPSDAAVMAEELKKKNIGMHLVDANIDSMSDFGTLWLTMLAVFASLESQIKSVRNKEVASELRASGRPIGTTPFHCKVVVRNGVKKLKHDFEAMKWMAAAWMMQKVGYTLDQTSDVLHSYWSQLKRKKPIGTGRRPRESWDRYRCRFGRIRFEEMMTTLPQGALDQVMDAAIDLLASPIDDCYSRFSTVPLPVERIEDRLAEAGIARSLPCC